MVSWNIERGVRFAGVLETLKKLDADVLLLQEVDRIALAAAGATSPPTWRPRSG